MSDNKEIQIENNEMNEVIENKNGDDSEHRNKAEEKREEKMFTQADVDRIVKERLERERRKREEALERERREAERKRLEEQQEYKKLYESLKAEMLEAKKEALMAQAGYTEEQIRRYSKYVIGDSEEELKASLDELKSDIPPRPQYVDPAVSNPPTHRPAQKSGYEYGKELFERIRGRKRI